MDEGRAEIRSYAFDLSLAAASTASEIVAPNFRGGASLACLGSSRRLGEAASIPRAALIGSTL